MNRRQFIKGSIVTTGAVIAGAGSLNLLVDKVSKDKLTIKYAVAIIDQLLIQALDSSGAWSPYQVFMHCAQSIEYSMSNFPEHKSTVFKGTIGKLAFSAFEHNGRMTHGLSDPIPGAPSFEPNKNTEEALMHLRNTFVSFDHYQGKIAPHFAYGELTKSEFEMAHVMHFYNHLIEIIS